MDFRKPRSKNPEKKGANSLIELAEAYGWVVRRVNVSAGIYSTPGIFDYMFTHPRNQKFCFVETKVEGNYLRDSQIEFATEMAAAGVVCFVMTDHREYKMLDDPEMWRLKGNWWRFAFKAK